MNPAHAVVVPLNLCWQDSPSSLFQDPPLRSYPDLSLRCGPHPLPWRLFLPSHSKLPHAPTAAVPIAPFSPFPCRRFIHPPIPVELSFYPPLRTFLFPSPPRPVSGDLSPVFPSTVPTTIKVSIAMQAIFCEASTHHFLGVLVYNSNRCFGAFVKRRTITHRDPNQILVYRDPFLDPYEFRLGPPDSGCKPGSRIPPPFPSLLP